MSIIIFDSKINIYDVPTPTGGQIIIAYDLDGSLKTKDEFGIILPLGGENSLSQSLLLGNTTGNTSIILESAIVGTNSNAQLSMNNNMIEMRTDGISYNTSYFQIDKEYSLLSIGSTLNPKSLLLNQYEASITFNNNNKLTLSNDGFDILVGNTKAIEIGSVLLKTNGQRSPIIISSENSNFVNNLHNVVILGGNNITATQSNAVYVSDLYTNGSIRSINGNSEINIGSDLILSSNSGSFGIISSTSSYTFKTGGIVLSDTSHTVMSPNKDTDITFISSKQSIANIGVRNAVAIAKTAHISDFNFVINIIVSAFIRILV